jgi:hypothetical protein
VYVPRWNFKKTMISGACTNNGWKIKLSTNRGHITFPWIWGLTGITFARRKSITITPKIYLSLCFTFVRITCYLEYILFTHNIFCILQHNWRCKKYKNNIYTNIWNINLKKIVEHACIKKPDNFEGNRYFSSPNVKIIGSFY